jgi:hypothetical protein
VQPDRIFFDGAVLAVFWSGALFLLVLICNIAHPPTIQHHRLHASGQSIVRVWVEIVVVIVLVRGSSENRDSQSEVTKL